MQSPDIPLNSGFYRVVTVELGPKGSVVNADWPTPVAGFCSGPFEKIMNSVFELWAEILPERAMACTFNLEYLLIGGRDTRHNTLPYFMWYDWMVGGWGARNGKDGWAASGPVFGVQLGTQPFEGQERLSPVLTTGHELIVDSWRARRIPRRHGRGKGRDAYTHVPARSCRIAATGSVQLPGAFGVVCRRYRTASGSIAASRTNVISARCSRACR